MPGNYITPKTSYLQDKDVSRSNIIGHTTIRKTQVFRIVAKDEFITFRL